MSTLLYCDLSNKKLRRSLGGAEFSFGTIPHIGVITLGLRFSKQVGNRHIEIYPTVAEIRASIGPLDQRPSAGQFSLKVGGGAPVLGTNVTTLLNWNATAEEIQAALRVLTGLGAATVVEDRGTFLVTGVAATIAVYENTLRPICFVRVKSYEVGSATTQSIRLQLAPFAFTDVFEERVPDPPTIERIQTGAEIDGTKYPEIQKLTIPLEFNGSYRLRRNSPLRKSPLLGVADGPEEIATAINPTADSIALADDADGLFEVEEHATEPANLIYFMGSMLGTSPPEIIVEVFDPPPADHWIHLNPQTAMTEEALRDKNLIRKVPIEIHADLAIDGMASKPYCLYRGECSIQEAVTHNDLGTEQNIDWINPPDAKSYRPVEANSLSSGVRFEPFTIGNGSDIEFQIPHNLETPRAKVHLRENATGGRDLDQGIDYRVVHDNNNACTITLLGTYAATPPELDALTGTVQDLTLTSTWLNPTVPIGNIPGLQELIDAMLAEIAELRALAGAPGGSFTRSLTTAGPLSRPLGTVWRVPRARTLPTRPESLVEWRATAETLGELPRRPIRLLPAVHASSTPALPATLPSLAAAKGKVYTVTTARGDLSGVRAGDKVACDGREFYKVIQSPGTTSYYPAAFETTLFETAINPLEFPARSTLELRIGLEMMVAMLEAKAEERRSVCQWTIVLEAGVPSADTTPATTGGNLASAFTSSVILLKQRLVLTEIPTQHLFGTRIVRAGDGTLTARAIAYGRDEATTAPPSVPFILRGKLTEFDTENTPTDARGVPAVRGLDVGLDGAPDPGLGRLVIS